MVDLERPPGKLFACLNWVPSIAQMEERINLSAWRAGVRAWPGITRSRTTGASSIIRCRPSRFLRWTEESGASWTA